MAPRKREGESRRERTSDPFVGMGAPRAEEAERYVLGCLLQDDRNAFMAVADQGLKAEDFCSERHRAIAEALFALFNESLPTDLIATSERLKASDALAAAGGLEYLQELAAGVASTAAVEHHCRLVKEKSLLRMVILAANSMIFGAQASDADAREVLAKAQQRVSELAQGQVRQGLRPIADLVDDTALLIEKLSKHDAVSGTPTGFARLDTLTTGLHGGELIILAARPGMGKTAFALSLALKSATNPRRPSAIALFSLEMSAEQLMLRMLCTQAQIPMQNLRSGRTSPEDAKKWPYALEAMKQAKLYIDDQPDLTMLDLRTKCRMLSDSLKRGGESGLGLIVIDYLQLISGGENAESRQVFISQVSRGLKQLAKELVVPILALSQLSRKIEDRPSGTSEPKLSDLRESGAIEQDADMVWFISRDNKVTADTVATDEPQEAKLIVAKHRNGPVDNIPLTWVPKYAGFYEPSFRPAGEEAPF